MLEAMSTLNESDYEGFGYDIKQVDISRYFMNAAEGTKRYLLNEDMSEEGLEKAKRQAARYPKIRS